jgi:hypothetical protein
MISPNANASPRLKKLTLRVHTTVILRIQLMSVLGIFPGIVLTLQFRIVASLGPYLEQRTIQAIPDKSDAPGRSTRLVVVGICSHCPVSVDGGYRFIDLLRPSPPRELRVG